MSEYETQAQEFLTKTNTTFMRSRILRADKKDEDLWDAIDLKDKNRIQDDASLATRGLVDIKTLMKESGHNEIYGK